LTCQSHHTLEDRLPQLMHEVETQAAEAEEHRLANKDAWVGAHTDAELIGASMYEVEPGNKQGPFHTHHANEEWAILALLPRPATPEIGMEF
jgi:uncharacterized cupin superfamily protein